MSDVGIKHSKPTTEAERQQEESSRSRPGANLGPGSSSSSLRPSDFFSLSPFALMRRWTEEMDRVFSVPPVSVRERDGKWVVTVDLPGLVKEEVAVEIADQNLIIQGKRKREDEERQTAYRRPYGTFYRVIPLPEGANADAASANFKNGILEVIIPIPPNQPLPESYSIKDHTQLTEAWVTSQLRVRDLERIWI